MPELNPVASDCVSELQIDEWLAGELSPCEQQRITQHLQTCSSCRARKDAIEQTSAAFFAEAPDFSALKGLRQTNGAQEPLAKPVPLRPRRNLGWLSAPLLAACAALAFVAVREGQGPTPAETRSKGAPRIGYYVKRGADVIRGEATGAVHPGDALRFVYTIDRDYYLAILSADAHGVGVYFPSGPTAQLVSAGQEVALDFSVALDGTLGRERVTAMFCPEVFDVDQLQGALSSGAVLPPALERCQSVGFELNKTAQ